MTAISIERPVPSDRVDSSADHSRLQRVIRGRESDPAWVRPSFAVLLLGTALLYVWGLGASGWANSFYSAAVQAGATSWKAMFFGSFDSSNFITVDKPPASLWVMEFSARIFGLNAWSVLVPQALEGVAAVALLYATVRRHFSATAGLLAGLVLATTPVATLMFRYNNPDALLVLLLVGAAYAITRALESTKTRWLVLAGALIGFGFITKMLQAFLVVPGFGLVYLVYAQTSLRRRLLQLLAAAVAIVLAAGWWVAAVTLTPASARPYVGGSTTDSILQLAFGYNGFGRLTGNETGSVGGGGAGGTGTWGATSIGRLFGSDMGSQISWLIPAALLLGGAGLWALRRTARSDGQRPQLLLWFGWLVVTGLVFSFGKGIIHPYYTVALAPAVGALVGIGATVLWPRRDQAWCRIVLAATTAVTAIWAHQLLARTPSWHPWLRGFILVGGLAVGAAAVIPSGGLSARWSHSGRLLAAAGVVVALAGPVAFSLDAASTAYTGAIPTAGPTATGAGFGGPGRQRGPGGQSGFGAGFGGRPSTPGRGSSGQGPTGPGAPGGFGPPSGFGAGLLNAGSVSAALTAALKADASSYTWAAATVGAENASGYQLATDEPVMAIGGFNGTDQAPSLAQFEKDVSAGKIHYFIGGGRGLGGGLGGSSQRGSSDSSEITAWVGSHFTATTFGAITVYNLTASTSTGTTATAAGT
ncbi:MAG TPA: glycosyltransferase family 39 protein [Mycobacteriales bacterium]|nr:glycosyltransferase family 39 protein [Mycobacteriales bacterium]